ncbi:hypothetical protein O1M54_11110 [Streptomyces diastatochromogenes]|nr:hypothetical protein [Streptomyces diastatochromogenes]
MTGSELTVFSAALGAAAQGHRARIVLAIDQFEDVVRMTSPTERELFLRALRTAVRSHPQLHLVLTLPSGFLHDPELRPYDDLLRTRFPLGTLTSRQTRAVIAGPARAAGADIAEEVVDDLVVEATEGDALPCSARSCAICTRRRARTTSSGRTCWRGPARCPRPSPGTRRAPTRGSSPSIPNSGWRRCC